MTSKVISRLHQRFLSQEMKEKSEKTILGIAILSYIIHLFLIVLTNYELINIESKFLSNPIAAIYTPFSFILLYEVFLLIFYLPQSISAYIAKQYEIITLIVIRRIFKDIANLELTSKWFQSKYDLQFTYDAVTSLVLFTLIYFFYSNIERRSKPEEGKSNQKDTKTFINLKKAIAIVLLPVLAILAIYSFGTWAAAIFSSYNNGIIAFKSINKIFFDEFFTILIITDVLLLLASFFYSDQFHKIIRNSGFVISTILIKISFSTEGIINNALIIGAVLFGFLMLIIHNKFERNSFTKFEQPNPYFRS
ncbi:MAG: hypothetical protein ACI81P_000703 [Neolewinella sp.]|jgi:hypothetical protein